MKKTSGSAHGFRRDVAGVKHVQVKNDVLMYDMIVTFFPFTKSHSSMPLLFTFLQSSRRPQINITQLMMVSYIS